MRLRVWPIALMLALLIACGGDEGPAATTTPDPAAAQPLTEGVDGALFIRSLDVGAPVMLKRLVQGQALPSPDGAQDVALYDFGPDLPGLGGAPGEGGNVVMSGQALALEGCAPAEPPCNGVFNSLRRVAPGAPVELLWQNATFRYQVVALCVVPTASFGDGLYRRTAEEQLTLLTGAGSWSSEQGWSHVLIVIAKPGPRTAIEPCPEGTAPVRQ